MTNDSSVNPAYVAWKLSTGEQKDLALFKLVKELRIYAKAVCWRRIPEHKNEFDALVNGIVWRAIGKSAEFKGKSRFSTWFYRIIINECNRFLRNHKELNETTLEEEMPSKTSGLDARIDVLAILDALDGQEHTLFRLIAEGEDFQSIGDALGISRNAALVRWNRLKARLRNAAI